MYSDYMKTIKILIQICVLIVMTNGVGAVTHLEGTITPIVIPQISSLEVSSQGIGTNGINTSFTLNSTNSDLKICKMVDIQDSVEVVSYIVL